MFSALGIGGLKLRNGDSVENLYVEGGILEIIENKMIILAESAMNLNDLNKDEIQKEMDEIIKDSSTERIFLHPNYKKVKTKLKLVSK
jgi:F0F1-type ATP synthase epsilon subunit